jgi:hypothetical protein
MKTHGTIVLGWDYGGRCVFAKTFDFGPDNETEREQALEAFAHVTKTCKTWQIGETEALLEMSKFKIEAEIED